MNITCPRCGASVPLPGTQPYTSCAHCDSSLWIDLGSLLLHTTMAATIDEAAARRMVRVPRSRGSASLLWRPFWLFTRGTRARMAPADSHLRTELDESEALSGRESAFAEDAGAAGRAVPPNVPLAAVLDEPERASARPRLVHVPFWEFAAAAGQISIDAVEGRLKLSPAESMAPEKPLFARAVSLLAAGFFLAGLLPSVAATLALALLLAGTGYWHLTARVR